MAQGFAAIQRNTISSTSGYKTLFEKITEKTKGEKKTFSWYRSAVKSEASSYNKNFKKYIFQNIYIQTSEQPKRKYSLRPTCTYIYILIIPFFYIKKFIHAY